MKKTLKKLTIVALILTMALGVFELSGCESFDLVKYKKTAKGKIDAHVATKTQSDYAVDKWLELLNSVSEGKQAVEIAMNNGAVDTAVEETKEKIDEVEIERDDGLDSEVRTKIIKWSYLWLELGQNDGVALEDVDSWWIDYYYGQYNGFYVFHFRTWGFGLTTEDTIDNLSFQNRGTFGILAVKEDCGGTLKEIFKNGHISRADLEEIYETHNNFLLK